VLVANIGSRDADPFELELKFMQSRDDDGAWYVDKLAGLKTARKDRYGLKYFGMQQTNALNSAYFVFPDIPSLRHPQNLQL
jgi:hypothetical protein